MNVFKGCITGFRGSWGSGIGYLFVEDEEESLHIISCENAPTVRALDACFGNVIGDGHIVRNDDEAGYVNQWIYYSLDDMGLILEAFTPVDDASEELVAEYEKQEIT